MAKVDDRLEKLKAPPPSESTSSEELTAAATVAEPPKTTIGSQVRLSIVNTEVFGVALRTAEYLPPGAIQGSSSGPEAYDLTSAHKKTHPLSPLLIGPIGVLQFPEVSPPHLVAALNLVFPERQVFRKGTDPLFISGVSKMMLLGAKIDKIGGRTIDSDVLKYIGSLEGIETLRGQLLSVIQSASTSLVGMLQAPSRGVWMMVDGHRRMMEEDAKPPVDDATAASDTPPP